MLFKDRGSFKGYLRFRVGTHYRKTMVVLNQRSNVSWETQLRYIVLMFHVGLGPFKLFRCEVGHRIFPNVVLGCILWRMVKWTKASARGKSFHSPTHRARDRGEK